MAPSPGVGMTQTSHLWMSNHSCLFFADVTQHVNQMGPVLLEARQRLPVGSRAFYIPVLAPDPCDPLRS